MSKTIRISDELAAEAEAAARISQRSSPEQIEHWAQLGRILEPALSFQAEQALKQAGRDQLDAVLSEVETTEGVTRAKAVIRQTSGSIESSD